MLIKIVKSVDGKPVVDSTPQHVESGYGRSMIQAGLAVGVLPYSPYAPGVEKVLGSYTTPTVPVVERPKPVTKWVIKSAERVNADWVKAPLLFVHCTCGKKAWFGGPNATAQEFRHCMVITHPMTGNYVKTTVEKCPADIAAQFDSAYKVWAKRWKPKAGNPGQSSLDVELARRDRFLQDQQEQGFDENYAWQRAQEARERQAGVKR